MSNIFNPDFIDFIRALNNAGVRYILVGGYAVILHGYHRSTGDLDIWVERTPQNYRALCGALNEFGLPLQGIPEEEFLNPERTDVFTFGRPPVQIDILTTVKGITFAKVYPMVEIVELQGVLLHVLDLQSLLIAKRASNRFKDLDDIQHLSDA